MVHVLLNTCQLKLVITTSVSNSPINLFPDRLSRFANISCQSFAFIKICSREADRELLRHSTLLSLNPFINWRCRKMGWPFQCKLRHENQLHIYISVVKLINGWAIEMNWLKDSMNDNFGRERSYQKMKDAVLWPTRVRLHNIRHNNRCR